MNKAFKKTNKQKNLKKSNNELLIFKNLLKKIKNREKS